MWKKIVSVLLVVSLAGIAGGNRVLAAGNESKDTAFAQKVRAGVAKLGTGTEARVEVTLRDKTKLKGWIREANDDGFVVMDAENGAPRSVAYPAVAQFRGHGHYGRRLLIASAVTLLVAVLIIVLSNDE